MKTSEAIIFLEQALEGVIVDAGDNYISRKILFTDEQKLAIQHAIDFMKRGAPDGWKLVPVEPTEKMTKAAGDAAFTYLTNKCPNPDPGLDVIHYTAMINAAPEVSYDRE